MKQLIILIVLFTAAIRTSAKTDDLLKANYLYSRQAFGEAIIYYQKAATTNSEAAVMIRLADCYRLTKDPGNAAVWYEKAMAMNAGNEEVKLNYAQVLMNLQQYDKAQQLLRQYQQSAPNDRRIANMIASCQMQSTGKQKIPVGTIQFASFNTDRSDFGPAIIDDEVYFTTDTIISGLSEENKKVPHPFYAIYGTKCAATGQCDGQLRTLGGNINTKYHDGPCAFANNGMMYFTRTNFEKKFLTRSPIPDNNDVVHLQIMEASEYDEAKNEYKRLTPFRFNNRNYSTAHPAINTKNDVLIFASDMPGGEGGNDLYVCTLDAYGHWSEPVNLGKTINTEGDEMFPYIAADNTLYFASDGHIGYGGLDVYEAKLANNTYTMPANIGAPVNSSYDDMSLVLDKTGKAGYFASNRPAAKGGDNIYTFNRQNLFLSVKVIDAQTGKALPGATVKLMSGNDTRNFTSDDRGNIFAPIAPDMRYMLNAWRTGYDTVSENLAAINPKLSDTLKKTIQLTRGFNIQYNVVVIDEKTRTPVENPKLVFIRNNPLSVDSVLLGTGETYTTSLEPNKTYNVYAVKDNYYGNEKLISTRNINPSSGGLKIRDTLLMKKLQIGEVYKIDDIYYDYNKANIRNDAKPALNRLLELLNQYPQMNIQVNSHTDCRGSDAYNLKLSNARAQSVMKYLQERGINIGRLKYKGYGESMPIDKCSVCEKCSEAQHQNNRRTEFQILAL